MQTLNAPDTTRGEMARIGMSVVIKGELSCSEDLYYIDGQGFFHGAMLLETTSAD